MKLKLFNEQMKEVFIPDLFKLNKPYIQKIPVIPEVNPKIPQINTVLILLGQCKNEHEFLISEKDPKDFKNFTHDALLYFDMSEKRYKRTKQLLMLSFTNCIRMKEPDFIPPNTYIENLDEDYLIICGAHCFENTSNRYKFYI